MSLTIRPSGCAKKAARRLSQAPGNMRISRLAIPVLVAFSFTASPGSAWPPLPKADFVAGRVATQADVNNGNAGFAIGGNGLIGSPLSITIPQYAYFNDNGTMVPVVLIQAEAAQGKQLASGKKADGSIVVGFLSDFTLLGTQSPP
jgi:hypothetical protein